jgi:hypothetical protein
MLAQKSIQLTCWTSVEKVVVIMKIAKSEFWRPVDELFCL